MGIDMPVHLANLAQNLIMLNEFDRLNPFDVFGSKTFNDVGDITRTPSFGLDKPKQLPVPFLSLRNRPSFDPDKTNLIEGQLFGIEAGVTTIGIGEDRNNRVDAKGAARLIQYLTGARQYKMNEEYGEIGKNINVRNDILELKKLLKRASKEKDERKVEDIKKIMDEYLEMAK